MKRDHFPKLYRFWLKHDRIPYVRNDLPLAQTSQRRLISSAELGRMVDFFADRKFRKKAKKILQQEEREINELQQKLKKALEENQKIRMLENSLRRRIEVEVEKNRELSAKIRKQFFQENQTRKASCP